MPRGPARPSADRGCCRASTLPPQAFDQNTGYSSAAKQSVPDIKGASAGVSVSWEIDLAGRLRAGAAAAAADTIAAEHGARGVRLLVLTDVATNYFTLVGALRQLETVRAISAAHDETLRLVTARQRVGLATPFDVERAQTDASRARAAIPPLETLAAVSRHRIAVLIGDQAFNAAGIVPWNGQIVVPPARAGQPAALLQRRPDLLALEAQLAGGQCAPAAGRTRSGSRGSFSAPCSGAESVELNGYQPSGAARFTNVFGLLAMPIFNAGRTQAINEIAESGQSRSRCCATRTGSCARSRTSRTRWSRSGMNGNAPRSLQTACSFGADAALGRAQSLYDRGQIDLLPLLDAQRTRLTVRVSANDSNTQLLLDSVQLYKALGGGWQVFEPGSPLQPPTPLSPNS